MIKEIIQENFPGLQESFLCQKTHKVSRSMNAKGHSKGTAHTIVRSKPWNKEKILKVQRSEK